MGQFLCYNVCMDFDKRERLASHRVIISEALMVVAVVAIVIALAFIVSGYWVNSDFTVERQGMLQISSVPTGASLIVDGETSWLSQTNTSKILKSGEHTISLTKDGYDTWSRTINIRDGLLYRIRYPRLFLQKRTPASVLDTTNATFASFSPDRQTLLLANNTTKWKLVKLDRDELKPTAIDITPYFSNVSPAEGATEGAFTGTIKSATWDSNNEHILFEINTGPSTNWTLLDINNPTSSLNLSQISSLSFKQIVIFDDSANTLVALDDGGNLYTIDVSRQKVSAPFASHVEYFDHYNNQIIYSALEADTATLDSSSAMTPTDATVITDTAGESSSPTQSEQYIVAFKSPSDEKPRILKRTATPVRPAIFQFYDERYLVTLAETVLTLYHADNLSADSITGASSYPLSFAPDSLKVGDNGEYITTSAGNHIAALDMEAGSVTEWTTEGASYDWLAGGMIYSVSSGELIVYDFDGLNRRSISTNVSPDFPVAITDNKWLYYFSESQLIREIIVR